MENGKNFGKLVICFLFEFYLSKPNRYENMVPKWYSYAIGSLIGLNRFLIMANVLKPQINNDKLPQDIINRQVKNNVFAENLIHNNFKKFPRNF